MGETMANDSRTQPVSRAHGQRLRAITVTLAAILLAFAFPLLAQGSKIKQPLSESARRQKPKTPDKALAPKDEKKAAADEEAEAPDAPEKKEVPDAEGDDPAATKLKHRLRKLIGRVRSGKRDTIYQAAVELAELGEAAKPALKAVKAVQQDNNDTTVQIGTRYALARMGDNTEAHIDWLNAFIAKTSEDRPRSDW